MDNDVVDFPTREGPPDMRGPDRSGCGVIIEGRLIPKLHMYDRGDTIEFILDGRFSYEFPKELAWLAGSFAANAMAIGSGYPFLGAESKSQPFAPQCQEIVL
jgi:hypothetical protein